MFTCRTMCRTHNSAMGTQGHSSRSRVWAREFRVHSISPLPLEGFSFNFGQMIASVKWCKWCAEPIQTCRHTSQFKVTVLSLEFCVRFVPLLPLGGFSLNFGQMFTSVGQCAEPKTQPYGLKVKVTVEGHEFEPWIWCRLHISFTPGRIFFKLWSNVCLSEMMCRTHLSYATSRSRSQLKVTSLSLEFWGRSIAIQTALLNLGQMFALVRWCAEPITKQCRLKVKVTIEGHQFEPWILRQLHCHSAAGDITVFRLPC